MYLYSKTRRPFYSAKINFLQRFSLSCLEDVRYVRPLHCTLSLLPFIAFYILPDICYLSFLNIFCEFCFKLTIHKEGVSKLWFSLMNITLLDYY